MPYPTVEMSRLLRRSLVDHASGVGLVLILDTGRRAVERLPGLGLLVLLDQGAEPTAAGESDISDAVALEVVLGADIGTLHRHGKPVQSEAATRAEEKTL